MQAERQEKILERYMILGAPKVEVEILEDAEGRRYYNVIEPKLNTEVRRSAYQELMELVSNDLYLLDRINASSSVEKAYQLLLPIAESIVRDKVKGGLLKKKPKDLESKIHEAAQAVAYEAAKELVGYGVIEPLIRDPYIEDISCNGIGIPIFVYHTKYEWLTTNLVIADQRYLESLVSKLGVRSGKEPSVATPIVEGVLKPEGYRVNIVLGTVSRNGPQFTIRKFRSEPFTMIELLRKRALDPQVAALLWMAVEAKQGIIIYGPTGSGKTTLLNAVTMFVPTEFKIVTAEDTPEIYLPFHENWGAMVTRLSTDERVQNVTLQAQVEAALRQRPDIIIIGEIRSREAFAFFQALSTGHGGLTTVHAESADVLIKRLKSPPMNVPASLIATARLFVNILRVERGLTVERKVVRVHESVRYNPDLDDVDLQEIMVWDPATDSWKILTRNLATLRVIADLRLISYEEALEDLKRRATVLHWLTNIGADIATLHSVVRQYRRDPESVYQRALAEVKEYELRFA
ncbi:MAG: type II/IV secretion system ATPase subunit [Acidilobus sp.]